MASTPPFVHKATSLSILGKLICICFVLWLYCVVCDQTDNLKKSSAPRSHFVPITGSPAAALDVCLPAWMSGLGFSCLCAGSRSQTRISDVTSCHKEFPYKLLESFHHILINDYYANSCHFISVSGNNPWSVNNSFFLLMIQRWTDSHWIQRQIQEYSDSRVLDFKKTYAEEHVPDPATLSNIVWRQSKKK